MLIEKKPVFETKEEDNKETIRCIEICQQDLGNAYFNQFQRMIRVITK